MCYFIFSLHLWQIVGFSLSSPTVSEYIQHLSHFSPSACSTFIPIASSLFLLFSSISSAAALFRSIAYTRISGDCNAAAMDTRIKATVTSTMYDMSRVNAKGYFDAADSADARYETRKALNAQRTADYQSGSYVRAGGVVDPLPEDAPFFVKDYYDYYKTERGYTERSLNSNDGWNLTSSLSFLNMPILRYTNEIRSAVLIIHGEKAHSCYFSKDAFADMVNGNPYRENKELLLLPDAVHTDLYDRKDIIPFEKIEQFFREYLRA